MIQTSFHVILIPKSREQVPYPLYQSGMIIKVLYFQSLLSRIQRSTYQSTNVWKYSQLKSILQYASTLFLRWHSIFHFFPSISSLGSKCVWVSCCFFFFWLVMHLLNFLISSLTMYSCVYGDLLWSTLHLNCLFSNK